MKTETEIVYTSVSGKRYTYNDIVERIKEIGRKYNFTEKQAVYMTDFFLENADYETPELFFTFSVDIEECILVEEDNIFTEEQKEMCRVH